MTPQQIVAVALRLFAVWLGGTLAMTTKGALALVVGHKLSERIPQRMIRTIACASCGLLGILALGNVLFR